MSTRATRSTAPNADVLIGRATGDLFRALLPGIVSTALRAEALVHGVARDPLHPKRAADRWLAEMDRSFDVAVEGARPLRAFDAINGCFMIHYGSTHVGLAPEGAEADAVVRTHAHAPEAPMGFYNARAAREALREIAGLLEDAIASQESPNLDRVRAENARARIGRALAHLDALFAAMDAHPLLRELERAATLAHDVKRPGDAADRSLAALLPELQAWTDAHAGELAPEVARTLRRDLLTIAADRAKWLAYHADSVGSYYVSRRSSGPVDASRSRPGTR